VVLTHFWLHSLAAAQFSTCPEYFCFTSLSYAQFLRRRINVGKQLLKEKAGLTPNQQVNTYSHHVPTCRRDGMLFAYFCTPLAAAPMRSLSPTRTLWRYLSCSPPCRVSVNVCALQRVPLVPFSPLIPPSRSNVAALCASDSPCPCYCWFDVSMNTSMLNTTDGPGIHGLPHASVDSRPALAHARHCPAESPARVATIALPHGVFLVSKSGLGLTRTISPFLSSLQVLFSLY